MQLFQLHFSPPAFTQCDDRPYTAHLARTADSPSLPASLSILGCLPPPNGREVERNGKCFFTQPMCEKTDTPLGRHSASPIVLPYACARRDDACAHESRKLTWSFGNGERSLGAWEERAAKSDRFGTLKRTLSVRRLLGWSRP